MTASGLQPRALGERRCDLTRRIRSHDVDTGGDSAGDTLTPTVGRGIDGPDVDEHAGLVEERGRVETVVEHVLEECQAEMQLASAGDEGRQRLEALAKVVGRRDRPTER